MKRILIAFLLAACSSSAPAPTAPTPTEPAPTPTEPTADPSAGSGSAAPTEQPADKPAEKPTGGPGIGENCGANDACAAGTECVKYYGIAGPRGGEFKTCEIKCSGKGGTCPAGKNCVTIADGPGSVCR